MANSIFSSSSGSLKIGVLTLLIVFIIHITGFILPKWSTFNFNVMVTDFSLNAEYHIGLLQDSICIFVYGRCACSYMIKHDFTGSIKAVLIMETFSVIGLIISLVLSTVLLFVRQNFILRLLNLGFVCSSGICNVIGVIVYGFFCNGDTEDTMKYVTSVINTLNMSSNYVTLGTSFILCTIAGSLCLLLCTCLFIADFRRVNKQLKPIEYEEDVI